MKNLAEGSILKNLFIFSLPMIISDFIQGSVSLIDLFYIGNIIGYQGISSISIVIPIVFLLFSILIGIGVSTNVLVAQAFGAGNEKTLTSVISNSLTMTVITSIILSLIGFITSTPVLILLNVPKTIFKDALTYLQIYTLSIPITALLNYFMALTRAVGNSKLSLYSSLVLLVSKIVLTPLFIGGFYIIPPLGIPGSIISTVAIELLITLGIVLYITRKYATIKKGLRFSIDRNMIPKFIGIGFPASLQMIIISTSATILMRFISEFGEKAIAVFGIGNRIDQFAFLPALSLGMALTTISSQNLSANRQDRLEEFLKWSVILSTTISITIVIIANTFSKDIFFFFSKNEEITTMGVDYIKIMSLSYLIMGLVFSMQGIIRGAGDTFAILGIKIFSMVILRIPISYILAFSILKSPNGIWLSFPIMMVFETIVSWLYLKSENWKKKLVFRKPTQ
ncbi:MAG: MATE family efflux transporter [Brevinematia bacterium]